MENPRATSTGLWFAASAGAALAGGLLLRGRRARAGRRDRARIVALEDSTGVDEDGAVRSLQRADLLIDVAALEAIWTPADLERLARTYWRFLSRITLGLIRVHYAPDGRSIVLLGRPLRLLSFQAPEYEMDATRGLVRWRIDRGLLVARGHRGDGYLQIEVRRSDAEAAARSNGSAQASAERPPEEKDGRVPLHVEVEVANFYPAIASHLSRGLYNATQSRIHVIVTYAFLRSLTRLDLAESRVGQLVG